MNNICLVFDKYVVLIMYRYVCSATANKVSIKNFDSTLVKAAFKLKCEFKSVS